MRPGLFEAAVAAVLAARLNALRSTQGERTSVADIFTGCSMSPLQQWMSVKVAGDVTLLSETVLGDEADMATTGGRRVLAGRATTWERGTLPLAEYGGCILRCARGRG
jgi:hypothetical protein